MKAFLQSLDKKVWLAVKVRWTKPTDPPTSWDDDKIKAANFNIRVLNVLFSVVTNEEFKKISNAKVPMKHGQSFKTLVKVSKL